MFVFSDLSIIVENFFDVFLSRVRKKPFTLFRRKEVDVLLFDLKVVSSLNSSLFMNKTKSSLNLSINDFSNLKRLKITFSCVSHFSEFFNFNVTLLHFEIS